MSRSASTVEFPASFIPLVPCVTLRISNCVRLIEIEGHAVATLIGLKRFETT